MPYLISDSETPGEKIHELRLGRNTIGRGQDNSIVVMHGSLSRHHAEIAIASEQATLRDLNSLNGSCVNGTRINQCQLKDGDSIHLGSVGFKFVEALGSTERESPDDTDPEISIITRFLPEQTRITRHSSLYQDRAGVSVLRLAQEDTNQRALDKLQILLEVSKQLSSPEEPDKLLEKILDLLFKNMNLDRAVILMVNEATGQLERKAVKLRSGVPVDYQFYSKKIVNLVRSNGEAFLTTDASSDQRINNLDSILAQSIHASMCVPLKPREKVIGVLYVDNLSMTGVYLDEDLQFITCLANQAAIAIDNSQLYKKMQAEAVMRDKLERFFPQAVTKKLREEGNLAVVDTEVTALFSDISSFTEMSSTMEPRQVIEMLNEYFQVMVEDIVFRYEGTLEKYIGDALLAVWGAPYQKANDAEQAVRAAIEMQWTIRRLNQEWEQRGKQPIQIHIGLNTGKVAAGNIGSEKLIQYATIGDTTNVTSRICSAAKAGEILISQSTFDKLKGLNLHIEDMGFFNLKGKTEPFKLYRVVWEQVKPEITSPST